MQVQGAVHGLGHPIERHQAPILQTDLLEESGILKSDGRVARIHFDKFDLLLAGSIRFVKARRQCSKDATATIPKGNGPDRPDFI